MIARFQHGCCGLLICCVRMHPPAVTHGWALHARLPQVPTAQLFAAALLMFAAAPTAAHQLRLASCSAGRAISCAGAATGL